MGLKLVVVSLLLSFLFHIQKSRVATNVTLVPNGKGLLLLYVGLGVGKIHNDLLATEAFDYADKKYSLVGLITLLQ